MTQMNPNQPVLPITQPPVQTPPAPETPPEPQPTPPVTTLAPDRTEAPSPAESFPSVGEASPGTHTPAMPFPVQPTEPQPAPPTSYIIEGMKQAGINPEGFQDDAQIMGAIEQVSQSAREADELRKQVAEYQQALAAQQLDAAPPAPAQDKPEADPSNPWNPPAHDPIYDGMMEKDGNGFWVPTDPRVPGVFVASRNANEQYRLNWAKQFTADPYKDIWEGNLERRKQMVREETQRTLRQELASMRTEAYIDQHADTFYQRDAQGQVVTDRGGEPQWSPVGQRWLQHAQYARDNGLGVDPQTNEMNEDMVREYAGRMLDRDIYVQQQQQAWMQQQQQAQQQQMQPPPPEMQPGNGQSVQMPPQQPQAPQTPEQVNEQLKEAYALRGMQQPNRDGTVIAARRPDGPPQNAYVSDDSLFDSALQDTLREQGRRL